MPATIAAGNLLVCFIRIAAAVTVTSLVDNLSASWTILGPVENSDASDDNTYIYYKVAAGTESTGTLDLSTTAKGTATIWSISGAADPATQAPETAVATGTGANVDCPSISPTGGSKDYLILALAGLDGETQTFTAPSGYSNRIDGNSGTGGAAATNCRTSGASKQVTAASEDPGAFTNGAPSTGWTGITLAIHPAAAATPTSLDLGAFDRRTPRRRTLQRM